MYEKRTLTFRGNNKNVKFIVEYTSYGFMISVVSPQSGKDCLCCVGDSKSGCCYAVKRGINNIKVTFCNPFEIPEELEYPSARWEKTIKNFYMFKQTPNDRLLIVKPMVKNDHICGIRILCNESEQKDSLNFLEIFAIDKQNGKTTLGIAVKGMIINPE